MMRAIILLLWLQVLLPQVVQDDIAEDEISREEYATIDNSKINISSYIHPYIINRSRREYRNLLPGKNMRVEPVMGVRWSSAGFEMDPNHTPSPVLWVSPGIKVSASTYLFDPVLNLWLYAWGRFHKHSAYGFNGSPVISDRKLFPYRPDYSVEYYSRTVKPKNGIDFDESLGGIALVTPKFHVIWGKFRDHFGPSSRSNLHLSRLTPSYSQFRIVVKPSSRFTFTYMLGQLASGIPDSSLYRDIYEDTLDQTVKMPSVPRWVAMHRIDYINTQRTFRLGLWEEVIFGGRPVPFEYMNPVNFFWSAQHKLGDVDNVIMGTDWEWMMKDQRVYGALLIDEWAPFDTFKGSREHNWFGWQTGTSRIIRARYLKMMITLEYTHMDPRIGIHRFPVNDPQHHGYNMGYWSGGHSDDWWLSMMFFLSDNTSARLYWTSLRKGGQDRGKIYEDQPIRWMDGDMGKRQETGFDIWIWNSHQVRYSLSIRWLKTQNMYDDRHFIDMTVGAFYNIHR